MCIPGVGSDVALRRGADFEPFQTDATKLIRQLAAEQGVKAAPNIGGSGHRFDANPSDM